MGCDKCLTLSSHLPWSLSASHLAVSNGSRLDLLLWACLIASVVVIVVNNNNNNVMVVVIMISRCGPSSDVIMMFIITSENCHNTKGDI